MTEGSRILLQMFNSCEDLLEVERSYHLGLLTRRPTLGYLRIDAGLKDHLYQSGYIEANLFKVGDH